MLRHQYILTNKDMENAPPNEFSMTRVHALNVNILEFFTIVDKCMPTVSNFQNFRETSPVFILKWYIGTKDGNYEKLPNSVY